ncbi:hypothetical protein [Schlesneria sp. T3-172]|uniref:hypothetical protein n=1 Tax=Schlesneria sphaerica TaxID=3373610 RepID=UPI0037C7DB11
MLNDDHDIEIPLTRSGIVWGISVTGFVWIFFGLCVPIAIWDFVDKLFPNTKVEKLGQIGDMFGAVNALFSSLAFFAAILALMLQIKELRESGERRNEERSQQLEQARLTVEGFRLQKSILEDQRRERIWVVLNSIIDGMTALETKVQLHLNYIGLGSHDVKSAPQFTIPKEMTTFDDIQDAIRVFLLPLSHVSFYIPQHLAQLSDAMKQFADVIADAFLDQPDGAPKVLPDMSELHDLLTPYRKSVSNLVGMIVRELNARTDAEVRC